MGFFSGRVSYIRFKVEGHAPGSFNEEYLERLAANRVGTRVVTSADGVEVGWIAGEHILDTNFDFAKNIINDTLQFAIRVDSTKIPGDLLRAYTALELKALAGKNPSGIPSNKQRREAKETARHRIEDEAKDGRFLKRRATPVLWDARSNELLLGTNSLTIIDQLHTLFGQTFGHKFELISSGTLAFRLAEGRGQSRGIDDARPSAFLPGLSTEDVAWIMDDVSKDYLGNEFLLWLWYSLDTGEDTIPLSDGSEATVMLANSLTLECPRGQTGKETISHEGPTRLPEAKRAIQSGKLPRKAGMIVVRHDAQYDLTLGAEILGVSGARLPAVEAGDERGRLDERVDQLRHLVETMDLLFDAYGKVRAGDEWPKELERMRKWLQRDEKAARMGAVG